MDVEFLKPRRRLRRVFGFPRCLVSASGQKRKFLLGGSLSALGQQRKIQNVNAKFNPACSRFRTPLSR